MKVLVVEPMKAPYEKEIKGLKQMQETVGGRITAIYPFEDLVGVICNDDGGGFNRSMPGGYGGVFGTFFVCGLKGEDFTSLSPELMEKYSKYFHKVEILLGATENKPITLKVDPPKAQTPGGSTKKPPTPER